MSRLRETVGAVDAIYLPSRAPSLLPCCCTRHLPRRDCCWWRWRRPLWCVRMLAPTSRHVRTQDPAEILAVAPSRQRNESINTPRGVPSAQERGATSWRPGVGKINQPLLVPEMEMPRLQPISWTQVFLLSPTSEPCHLDDAPSSLGHTTTRRSIKGAMLSGTMTQPSDCWGIVQCQ